MYEIVNKLGATAAFVGFMILFFEIERTSINSKYLLTIFNLISIIIFLILPFNVSRPINYLISLIDAAILLFILMWFSKKSSLEFQAVSTFMLIGFIIFLAALALDSALIKGIGLFNLAAAPIFVIIGAFIAIAPTMINPEHLSKSITNWFILIIMQALILVIGVLGLLVVQLEQLPVLMPHAEFFYLIIGIAWILMITFGLIMIYSINQVIKIIKQRYSSTGFKEDKQDFLKIFIKPQKLTEEEVFISKEKKLCLVCKGKLGGFLFMCFDCGAFYCEKCANTLSSLENACWVCNTPFDESKPVKSLKAEIKEVPLEEEIHKKKN